MSRKLSFLFILALFASHYSRAQSPEQDCINAIPVCQNIYTQTNSYVGTGTFPLELNATNQGCLASGERNDVWYVINVTTSGILNFTITPNNANDDYDFAVWDITNVGCEAIYNYSTNSANPYLPVACNYSGTPGPTGLATPPPTGTQWDPGLAVTAGQTLVLNVSNFSSTQTGYTLDFTPSTASIFDNVPPSVTGVFTHCQYPSDVLTIRTSEPVKCNSITATGSEWTITPAGGAPTVVSATGLNCGTSQYSATTTITLTLSAVLAPGAYNLNLANGTDNNTLLDNCGNAAAAGPIPFTIVTPDPRKMVAVDTPACIHARVILDRSIKCSTVAEDGSDFKVTGPSPVKVIRAIPYNCDNYGLSDTLELFFDKSIYVPGTYTIALQVGTDGDAVADTCGGVLANTIDFVVSDQGYVIGIASPNVLCEPGYTNLASAVFTDPAPVQVGCGLNNSVCNGTPTLYTLGSATATGTTTNSPFYASNSDARTQMIFRADELRAAGMRAGTINQLAMEVTSTSGNYYVDFTIKMSCTSLSSLDGFVSGLPIVYQAPGGYLASLGTNTFDLDKTYDWDGVSNIIVEMCYHNAGGNISDDAVQTTTGLFPGAVYHRHAFGSNGCSLTNLNGTASADRPNITFSACAPARKVFTYLWTPSSLLNDSTSANTFGYVTQTKTYQVEIMDSNSCYRRDTAGVIVSVRHPAISADTAICLGGEIQLNAAGGYSYLWSPTAGLSCSDCPNPFASPTQTTLYSAYITDELGCTDTLTTNLIVHPLPLLNVNTHDTAIVFGVPVQLFAKGSEAVHYLWTPAAGLSDNLSPNPLANPRLSTSYVVMVTDIHKCRSFDTVQVRVRTDVPILIPSAFSPNGDGVNDVFGIVNLTFHRVIEFRVFNRWGQEVFTTQESNKGWDGTYKGEKSPVGVYQYLIRIASPDGQTRTFKGDVTLVQ